MSSCQADFSFAASKLIIQTLVCSSITILKHPPTYQSSHSQVLDIIPVKITIMNKF